MKIVILLIVGIGLTGCAGPKIQSGDAIMIEQSRSHAKAVCSQAQANAEIARMQTIASLPESQVGMALMADAMARQAEAFAGKDPCASGMGYFEYGATVAESQNQTIRTVAPAVVSGTVIGLGIVEGGKVIRSAIENTGAKTTINGDGNSTTQEIHQVRSDTRVDVSGEGATTGDIGGTPGATDSFAPGLPIDIVTEEVGLEEVVVEVE